jgi:hypothetical protein
VPSGIKFKKNSKNQKQTQHQIKNLPLRKRQNIGQPSVFVSLSAMGAFIWQQVKGRTDVLNSLLLSDPTGLLEQQVLVRFQSF